MSDGGALTCPRDGTSTRLTCVECATPICPTCSVRTPVGLKCPDHATAPGRAGRTRRAGGGRRSRLLTAVVAVAAVAGGVYAATRLSVSDPATFPCPTQTSPDVGIGPESRGTSWSEMEPSPLCGRILAATAWTGTELLVWGGQSCAGEECPIRRAPRLADGAAYDPDGDRWRRMAESPLEARDAPASVWTGRELVVWGGSGASGVPLADGAAYDPARDRWRRIAPAPLSARWSAAAVWTGEEVVVVGGAAPGGVGPATARYDPQADRWEESGPAPLPERSAPVGVWTGAEVLVWAGDPDLPPGAAAFHPATGAWRPVPPGFDGPRSGVAAVWSGRELIVWGGYGPAGRFLGDGAAYDPAADAWRPLPPGLLSGRSDALAVWTGGEMVIWGGLGHPDPSRHRPGLARNSPYLDPAATVPLADGAAYDPAANRWRAVEDTTLLARGFPLGAWDGRRLLVWGGVTLVDSLASAADGARHTR